MFNAVQQALREVVWAGCADTVTKDQCAPFLNQVGSWYEHKENIVRHGTHHQDCEKAGKFEDRAMDEWDLHDIEEKSTIASDTNLSPERSPSRPTGCPRFQLIQNHKYRMFVTVPAVIVSSALTVAKNGIKETLFNSHFWVWQVLQTQKRPQLEIVRYPPPLKSTIVKIVMRWPRAGRGTLLYGHGLQQRSFIWKAEALHWERGKPSWKMAWRLKIQRNFQALHGLNPISSIFSLFKRCVPQTESIGDQDVLNTMLHGESSWVHS